ncbi:DUF6893 family small protein [Nocardioides donggukensis]
MRTIGMLTTIIAAAVAVGAVAVGIRSAPDIKRYLRMRQM